MKKMRAHLIIDLLKKEKVVGLNLSLVNGEKEQVNEVKKSHTNDKELFVETPHEVIINLDHVVSIKPIYEIDYDAVDRVF